MIWVGNFKSPQLALHKPRFAAPLKVPHLAAQRLRAARRQSSLSNAQLSGPPAR
jgi:hypothetical protein